LLIPFLAVESFRSHFLVFCTAPYGLIETFSSDAIAKAGNSEEKASC